MDPTRGGGDTRYNLNYGMSGIGLSLTDQADLYGNPAAVLGAGGVGRNLMHNSNSGGGSGNIGIGAGGGGIIGIGQCQNLGGNNNNNNNNTSGSNQRGIKRTNSDCYEDHHRSQQQMTSQQSLQGLDNCTGGGGGGGSGGGGSTNNNNNNNGVTGPDMVDDNNTNYTSLQTSKKSPPANGKKTKGRVKIKMEYIDNKLRRYTTFSKRKTGIMKKAYELSTLTGTQVMLLVASETGHVYTFATRKLQPMITSEAGKQLIQTCLNSPDPPTSGSSGGDQRMSATGFEETELSYNIADEDSKDDRSPCSSGNESDDSSDIDSPGPVSSSMTNSQTILIEPPLLVPSSSNNSSKSHQQQPETPIASSSTSTVTKSTANQLPINSTIHYDVMKLNNSNSNNNSNVLYPSTLANIPQEVLLSLVQAGHLQLHTEDDGSGHQYITIPLSMTTTSVNNTHSISGGCGNNGNDGVISTTSSSTVIGLPSASASSSQNNNSKIHVKDFNVGKISATTALGKTNTTAAATTTNINGGNLSTSTSNGEESLTLKIKKEIE